jgi:hypothetical protein
MRVALVLGLLLAGCAVDEVRTTSTEGRPPEQLARLRVAAHHEGLRGFSHPAHLRTLVIDGTPFAIDHETTDFWLAPGEHRVRARYEDCIHGPTAGERSDRDAFINDGYSRPSFTAEAGRSYALSCVVAWNSGPWVTLVFNKLE